MTISHRLIDLFIRSINLALDDGLILWVFAIVVLKRKEEFSSRVSEFRELSDFEGVLCKQPLAAEVLLFRIRSLVFPFDCFTPIEML